MKKRTFMTLTACLLAGALAVTPALADPSTQDVTSDDDATVTVNATVESNYKVQLPLAVTISKFACKDNADKFLWGADLPIFISGNIGTKQYITVSRDNVVTLNGSGNSVKLISMGFPASSLSESNYTDNLITNWETRLSKEGTKHDMCYGITTLTETDYLFHFDDDVDGEVTDIVNIGKEGLLKTWGIYTAQEPQAGTYSGTMNFTISLTTRPNAVPHEGPLHY